MADTLASAVQGKCIFDLRGFTVLLGIFDLHGDGFERHLVLRRGALKSLQQDFEVTNNELAANGVTTVVLAQFYSWEGGMRRQPLPSRFKKISTVLPLRST